MIILLICLFFKCVNGFTPSCLCDVLTPAGNIRIRRNSTDDDLLFVPYVSCDLFKQSFEYMAPGLWNSLPGYLREAVYKKLYKRMKF